jgi:hypothetical protein
MHVVLYLEVSRVACCNLPQRMASVLHDDSSLTVLHSWLTCSPGTLSVASISLNDVG